MSLSPGYFCKVRKTAASAEGSREDCVGQHVSDRAQLARSKSHGTVSLCHPEDRSAAFVGVTSAWLLRLFLS